MIDERVKNNSIPRIFLFLNNSDFSPLNASCILSSDDCNNTDTINRIAEIIAI